MGAATSDKLSSKKPRVLHVLGSLDFGGIETALLHMFRQKEKCGVEHEVLITTHQDGPVSAELERLGIRVRTMPISPGRLTWPARFRRLLLEKGPYAAVHSHIYLFSAVVLTAAKAAGVPIRIAHCHNARAQVQPGSVSQRLWRASSIAWLKWVATHRLGVSESAAVEIAGPDWKRQRRTGVLPLGFDFSQAHGAEARAQELSEKLGLRKTVPTIGHVGRFRPIKNHKFLLEAFARFQEQQGEAQLVLLGEGPLLEPAKRQAAALGIEDSVHFVGFTDDVAAYMVLFDLLVVPSFSEGLGLVCLEAQAVGTRCLASDAVPREIAVVPGAVEYLPLEAGPSGWADAMKRLIAEPADSADWRDMLNSSQFGVAHCINALDEIYLAATASRAQNVET